MWPPSRTAAFGGTKIGEVAFKWNVVLVYTDYWPGSKMNDDPRLRDKWTRNALLAFSAIAVYHAAWISTGMLSPLALRWLLIACLALMAGVFGPPIRRIEAFREKPVLIVLAAGLALQFIEHLKDSVHSFSGSPAPLVHKLFIAGIAACAVLTLAATAGLASSGKTWFVAVVIVHFFLGIAYLHIWGPPAIDVFVAQQDASAALLSGHNPYAMTFPNIYGEGTTLYGPGLIANGRTVFGFFYPPLSLFLCLPSYLLTGDVRFSHLAATTLSGLLIGFSGRGLLSRLAAVLFLFSPDVFFVVQSSWTEPFLVLLLAIVLFQCKLNCSPWLTLGLLLASKQYVVLAVPLAAWFLIRERSLRAFSALLLRAGAVTLAITLPLALWNFGAFFWSVVWFQFLQPFRPDALSIPAWLVSLGFPQPPAWPAFVALVVAGVFLLKRLRPSTAGFAASLAVIFMVFFSLNRQAFLNYYFLVGACLCSAIAASDVKDGLDPGNLVGEETVAKKACESGA